MPCCNEFDDLKKKLSKFKVAFLTIKKGSLIQKKIYYIKFNLFVICKK